MSIQFFAEINESHVATGYKGRTDLPAFHIFTLEDTYPETHQVMPPYRFGFYQIVLLENSSDASLSVNSEKVADLNDSLSFASPEHVLAWVRGELQRGVILYFKEEFLSNLVGAVQVEFPFFRLTDINLLHVNSSDKAIFCDYFEHLLEIFHSNHPYRVQMLQAQTLTLLYDCKKLYNLQQQSLKQIPAKNALVFRFQQYINQYYLTKKTVQAYAELLNISPDYLNQTIKAAVGKTAHALIAERIVLESKNLLRYSELTIAEIADYLGYIEPTHFGRFFRRQLGCSPLAWRQQNK